MTPSTSSTALAVFDDYSTAERAVRDLKNGGIPQEAIDINSNFATGTAGSTSTGNYAGDAGSASGQETGFMGWWHRTFGTDSEDDQRGHYAEAVRRGSAVVSVTGSPATLDRAITILNSAGAVDIDHRVNDYRTAGYQSYDATAPAYSYDEVLAERERLKAAPGKTGDNATIAVVEEELQVGKREVRRGGVRVYSRVVEQPVEESINLREEHVRVERRPVNRAVSESELANMRDQSVEVVEMAEEAVISKQARVREEIVIGKETTERVENVRDNVRHTEVTVDQIDKDRVK